MRGTEATGCLWGGLEVPSRPQSVPAVRRAVERLGRQAGLSPDAIDDLDLAVTEACANAIRHGSPDPERNRIYVAFYIASDSLTVEIRDEGHGFDPAAKRPPCPGEMRVGGYGLHIMRQVMDGVEVSYHDGTVVRLTKRRPSESGRERALTSPVAARIEPVPVLAV